MRLSPAEEKEETPETDTRPLKRIKSGTAVSSNNQEVKKPKNKASDREVLAQIVRRFVFFFPVGSIVYFSRAMLFV